MNNPCETVVTCARWRFLISVWFCCCFGHMWVVMEGKGDDKRGRGKKCVFFPAWRLRFPLSTFHFPPLKCTALRYSTLSTNNTLFIFSPPTLFSNPSFPLLCQNSNTLLNTNYLFMLKNHLHLSISVKYI